MLNIYNTLTRQKGLFLDLNTSIKMFVCGPTVYDYIHIGNARTYVFFDVVAKWLRYRKYDVNYIMNITDLDDKIITRAKEENTTWQNLASKYENLFLEDVKALGITAVDAYSRSGTDYIPEIIKQVQILLDKKNAYIIDEDGIYFDITSFKDYGKLSHRTLEMAEDGVSRIDLSEKKRNKGDFVIWKFSKKNEPSWDAYFEVSDHNGPYFAPDGATQGRTFVRMDGRPGWHIEDTAMTEKYFGPQYEIHGAGIDLVFPHHEAELSLMESQSGKVPFVKYWMHVGFLTSAKEKMSKSKSNFVTARQAQEKYSAEALRFYFLSAHYRSPLEYTEQNLSSAEAAITRIGELKNRLSQLVQGQTFNKKGNSKNESIQCLVLNTLKNIEKEMDDDFNTPKTFSHLFDLIKQVNQDLDAKRLSLSDTTEVLKLFDTIEHIFGIIPPTVIEFTPDIQSLVNQRQQAKLDKDYNKADKLRDEIQSKGYNIDDTPYGALVKKLI